MQFLRDIQRLLLTPGKSGSRLLRFIFHRVSRAAPWPEWAGGIGEVVIALADSGGGAGSHHVNDENSIGDGGAKLVPFASFRAVIRYAVRCGVSFLAGD